MKSVFSIGGAIAGLALGIAVAHAAPAPSGHLQGTSTTTATVAGDATDLSSRQRARRKMMRPRRSDRMMRRGMAPRRDISSGASKAGTGGGASGQGGGGAASRVQTNAPRGVPSVPTQQ